MPDAPEFTTVVKDPVHDGGDIDPPDGDDGPRRTSIPYNDFVDAIGRGPEYIRAAALTWVCFEGSTVPHAQWVELAAKLTNFIENGYSKADATRLTLVPKD